MQKRVFLFVNMETCNFSEHLMLDGYGEDPERIIDPDLAKLPMIELPNQHREFVKKYFKGIFKLEDLVS